MVHLLKNTYFQQACFIYHFLERIFRQLLLRQIIVLSGKYNTNTFVREKKEDFLQILNYAPEEQEQGPLWEQDQELNVVTLSLLFLSVLFYSSLHDGAAVSFFLRQASFSQLLNMSQFYRS